MRAVCQRVARAAVTVEDRERAAIGRGLLVLLGISRDDDEQAARELAAKIARLRLFDDDAGRFDRSLVEMGGSALVVSQFTLLAETRKGTRPSFSAAARPAEAEPLYRCFAAGLGDHGIRVETGIFGAKMQVELVNDGPVTIVLDA